MYIAITAVATATAAAAMADAIAAAATADDDNPMGYRWLISNRILRLMIYAKLRWNCCTPFSRANRSLLGVTALMLCRRKMQHPVLKFSI